jgi:transposase
MPTPLDPATLPRSTAALRRLLLQREAEHAAAQEQQAAELQTARNGLRELTLLHEKLKLRLARLLRQQYGASSEKLRAAINQLELTLGDIEEQIAEMMPPEPEQPPAPARPTSASVGPARRKPVRRPLPDSLPRDVVEHAAPCACPKCGGVLRPLGEDVTEVLDYVPACFRVIRHVRPKLSCRSCESIAQAPVPSLPIQRGLATPALLAHVLVAKYADHCPLYRQAEIYARAGVELDRSTLADWVGQSARLVRPMVDALGAHVMAAERVHADDTTVPVLDPGRGTTKTGRLWCYVRDDRPFGGTSPPAVLYRYSPDRKGEHPRTHLAGFRGILQADGYTGYAGLYQRGVTEAACMAHCRRPFFDLHASTGSPLALEALQRIAALYAIEATIRGQSPEARLAVRQAQSAPLFSDLRTWLEMTLSRISGKSELAGAIRYMLTRWNALTLVLHDGRACMGRVEMWRGCCRPNISVAAPFVWRCLTGPTLAPSPHPARQTGHADFPHPAFSRPVRPSLSAGRRVVGERSRGRASRRDTRLGSGGTQRLVVPSAASTSGGLVAPCMPG